jgi:hypothetical protein
MRRFVRLLAPLVCMSILWMQSALPETDGTLGGVPLTEAVQNLLHIPAYTLLSAAWLWMFGYVSARAGGWACCLAGGYGVIDEVHQAFVPGRCASWLDVALDVVGAALGVGLLTALQRVRHGGTRAEGGR